MCASFAHDTQIIQWQQIENHLHAMHIQAKNLTFVISHFYLPIKLSLICLNVFCSNFRMTEIVFAVIGFNQMKMPNCFFLALLSIFQLNRNVIRLNERSALSNEDKVTWRTVTFVAFHSNCRESLFWGTVRRTYYAFNNK